MFIRADKKTVLEKISPCLCAIATKSANLALSCLYLSANKEKNTVTVTTFDTSKGVKTEFDAFVLEEGGILIDALKFNSMVRSLPDGEISVSNDANFVTTIAAGQAKFEISGMSADRFPSLPELSGDKKFGIKEGVFKKMIQQVIFSAAVTDLKPVLTGVLFEIKNGDLRMCACDGYRLAIRDEKCIDGFNTDTSFIVPAKTLQEIIRLLSDDEDASLHIELARRHIIFMFGGFTMFSRYVDGDYIDYRRSLPTAVKTKIRMNLSDAADCFERCGLLIDERAKSPIRLTIGDETVNVKCETANGKIDENITCEAEGEGMTIGFNNKFMLEALRGALSCGDEEIILEFTSPLTGMSVKSPEKSNYYYMVVPMRLN